eukprot:Skav216402  [mRNA]  locus=scaffold457:337829:339188:+ [translate_table: standard]
MIANCGRLPVIDTGAPITVPVGEQTLGTPGAWPDPGCGVHRCDWLAGAVGRLGRIINIIGEPIDELGPIETKKFYAIHRPTPTFTEMNTTAQQLLTGIKALLGSVGQCTGEEVMGSPAEEKGEEV